MTIHTHLHVHVHACTHISLDLLLLGVVVVHDLPAQIRQHFHKLSVDVHQRITHGLQQVPQRVKCPGAEGEIHTLVNRTKIEDERQTRQRNQSNGLE